VLNHLDSIGLISFETVRGFSKGFANKFTGSYFGKNISLTLPKNNARFEVGMVILTRVGHDLARVCSPVPEEEFYNFMINYWKVRNFEIEEMN
jgi:hypothetical protein